MTIDEKKDLLKDGVKVRIKELITPTVTKVKVGDTVTFKEWFLKDQIDEYPIFETHEVYGFAIYVEHIEIIS